MTERPRPIRVALAFLTLMVSVALAVIPILVSFDLVAMTADQVGQLQFLIGTVSTGITGIILAFATNFKPLTIAQKLVGIKPVEGRVTPLIDPMGDEGTPLVPIGDDGLEDGAHEAPPTNPAF